MCKMLKEMMIELHTVSKKVSVVLQPIGKKCAGYQREHFEEN